ncbi:MAG TPA: UDP-N-acetylglucosamine 2-epimerase [Cyclobacteriaceae bacterium]|nr:UDP-N-acetylglucosamine 2-epimerase [Cyclobacteriaceae bacterium]
MRKICFLTGTRADFGKLKSLIKIASSSPDFEVAVVATGMHLLHQYGYTIHEIEKSGFQNIFSFSNYTDEASMDLTLAKTIEGLSKYVKENKPDLIVVHGDRVEALAGAIVGSLNNILVAHVEGGEVSGTIDELVRHAVTKMSHVHFVSNKNAMRRLVQLGELEEQIFVIGSPDVDVMLSKHLPLLVDVKSHYNIPFEEYAVTLFHPVTTEADMMPLYAEQFVEALLKTERNYVVIFPNNDLGSASILKAYERLKNNKRFCIFPSIRFEFFLVLIKNAQFMIGNSSAGIREAPYYGLPVVNVGTRQHNRAIHTNLINCDYQTYSIIEAVRLAETQKFNRTELYGTGNSDQLFLDVINQTAFWNIKKQKQFNDIVFQF